MSSTAAKAEKYQGNTIFQSNWDHFISRRHEVAKTELDELVIFKWQSSAWEVAKEKLSDRLIGYMQKRIYQPSNVAL